MKNFIKKITIFCLILLLFIIVPFVLLNIYHSLFFNEFNLDTSIATIFTGDSQIQTAINDGVIKNSINISSSAESYYFSYYKLQKNISLRTHRLKEFIWDLVIIVYLIHTIIILLAKQSGQISSSNFFILPIEERLKCLVWNSQTPFFYLKKIFRAEIAKVFSEQGVGYSNNFVHTRVSEKSMNKKIKHTIL